MLSLVGSGAWHKDIYTFEILLQWNSFIHLIFFTVDCTLLKLEKFEPLSGEGLTHSKGLNSQILLVTLCHAMSRIIYRLLYDRVCLLFMLQIPSKAFLIVPILTVLCMAVHVIFSFSIYVLLDTPLCRCPLGCQEIACPPVPA